MATALIAEDDAVTRDLMATACQQAGLQVATVGDGVEALEQIRAGGVDLLLLDLSMPRLDGFGVLEALRQQPLEPMPVVILVSAAADAQGKLHGAELGAIDFVEKPFRAEELSRRVARAYSIVELERVLQAERGSLATMRETDPVTGAGTFGHLHDVLEAEFQCARIGRRPLSCIMVSDEAFTSTLDAAGREAGEARLQRMAQLIARDLRGTDYVFRVDAAEFVVLLPGTPLEGARRVAAKIAEMAETIEGFDRGDLAMAVAYGPGPGVREADELFRAVNVALAQARADAGEKLCFFNHA